MHSALSAWVSVLGQEHVLTEGALLSGAQTATFATTQRILAVLRPATRPEVQACVRIAAEHRIPLYPVSGGKNWGLGSRVPVADQSVLLDMGRLNRILDFSEKLAYITLEPGVTFRQVDEFLCQRKSGLFLAATGGPADSSPIGNTVERGDATGPHGDRLANVCGMEVVLPTGECIHTGFGRFLGAQAAPVSRYGVGPYTDGLFTQSNLGIVTRLTMWLTARPASMQVAVCQIDDPGRLAGALDAVQQLMWTGVVREYCFSFWNRFKLLARAEPSAGVWFGCGAVYSPSRAVGLAERDLIDAALRPLVDQLDLYEEEPGNFVGRPSDDNVRSLYRHKKAPIPDSMDPDRDGCGAIWLCPELPFDGEVIVEALRLMESVVESHGLEPNLGLSCVSARSVHVFLALVYDRDQPGADERAMACHDEVARRLIEKGHLPYRLGIHSMRSLPAAADDSESFLAALKRALDPAGILAPGRYDGSYHGDVRGTPQTIQHGKELVEWARFDDARAFFEQLRSKPEHYLEATLWLGRVALLVGQSEEAIGYLEEVLALKPDHAEALALKGAYYILREQYREAIGLLEAARKADPDLAMVYGNLAAAYRNLGQLAEALEAAQEAVKLDPKSSQHHYELTQALALMGRLKDAIDEAVETLRINPLHLPARERLVDLYLETKNPQAALEHAQALIEQRGQAGDWRANFKLGEIYEDSGLLDAAKEQYQVAMAMAPEAFEPVNAFGLILLREQLPESARPFLEQARDLAPRHPDPALNLALCYAVLKKYELAEELATQVAAATPPGTHTHDEAERLVGAVRRESGKGPSIQ
jgi:4-cresol dehydrogenase (hydroxylating)